MILVEDKRKNKGEIKSSSSARGLPLLQRKIVIRKNSDNKKERRLSSPLQSHDIYYLVPLF
jgi:hypothetical protein